MMTQWYVKDLSKITGVTVQTLHHYDHIGLLKPSVRLPNGYRLYSERDLLTLQQIIALKFFGFELSHIKTLLSGHVDMADHFSLQARFLEEKAKSLFKASQTLKSISSECGDRPIPWENIIKLIEVYHMTRELEKTWAGKVLSPEELKDYATFQTGLKTRFTEDERQEFDLALVNLIAEIRANLDKDPRSDLGISIAKRFMERINTFYGKDNADLKHAVWNKGFKGGHMDKEHPLSPEMVAWLDNAIDGYYRGRIYAILNQVAPDASPDLTIRWNALMDEMYGDSKILKQDLVDAAMIDAGVSPAAREWLRNWIQA